MTADAEVLAGLRALLRPTVRQLVAEMLAEGGLAPQRPDAPLTTAEAAQWAGVKVDTILTWIGAGTLPASRPAGAKAWRIKRTDLESMLSGAQPTPAPADPVDQRQAVARRLVAAAGCAR